MKPRTTEGVRLLVLFLALVLLSGCATVPYLTLPEIEGARTLRLEPGEPQIERGRPVPFLDGLGHYVLSLPSKLILWNWRVDNHDISLETEEKLRRYLEDNGLLNVKVRINQYAVPAEWRRLVRNKAIHPAWRYTLGVCSIGIYTIMPGRAFGGDNYNPYTNTINIYSDHKAIVLHEGAHAKDFASRSYGFRGWYAAMRLLPLAPLYQEAVATGDAIGYDLAMRNTGDEKADYKILYPAYGTYISGEILQWAPVNVPIQLGIHATAIIAGHIAGRVKASAVDERPPEAAPPIAAPAIKEAPTGP